MLQILSERHKHVLTDFASANVLVAFDFDGTLAPFAHHPGLARMRPVTRRLLASVARRYPVIVISGRERHDLVRRVGSVPVWHLVGNHGVELGDGSARYPPQVEAWAGCLRRRLAPYPGIVVENKTYSVTVHYRRARAKARAAATIRRVVRRLSGARSIAGSEAISLVPSGAPDVVAVVHRARELLVCDVAIYVGDGHMDGAAFAAADGHRLLAIRVGRPRRSRVQYCLPGQSRVDALLQALIALRPLRRPSRSSLEP